MSKNEDDIGSKISDFEILQKLGKGTYGFVAKVRSKKNSKLYAMKISDLSLVIPDELKYYENEGIIMQKLNHKNVCRCYRTFREGKFLCMVLDLADNGNLCTFFISHMKLNKVIDEEKLWDIYEKCIRGLVYMHSEGVIHRDIKIENILMNNEGEIKYTDFNISVVTDIDKAKNFSNNIKEERQLVNNMTKIGTRYYKAPEAYEENNPKGTYTNKIDVYSLGKTFCVLAFKEYKIPLKCYQMRSKELVDILVGMLKEDPNERLTSKQLYNIFIRAYVEKYFRSTGLISVINCLSLYDSFRNYFLNEGNMIHSSNEVSYLFNKIIISFMEEKLQNITSYSYNFEEPDKEKFSNYIFQFRETLYKNGLKKDEDHKYELDPVPLVRFILVKIHEELNTKKSMNGADNNYFRSISNTNNPKIDALNNFMIFYKNNFKSIISDDFFGIIKRKKICNNCNTYRYLYHMVESIHFDLDVLFQYNPQKEYLKILDCFDCLNKKYLTLDENVKVTCYTCQNFTQHNIFKQFYYLPKNLIICFDRGADYHNRKFIDFDNQLNLTKYVELFLQGNFIYDLLGIICRIEEKTNNNIIKENYISFTRKNNSDNYVEFDFFNKKEEIYSLEQIKKFGVVVTLFYYCRNVPNY